MTFTIQKPEVSRMGRTPLPAAITVAVEPKPDAGVGVFFVAAVGLVSYPTGGYPQHEFPPLMYSDGSFRFYVTTNEGARSAMERVAQALGIVNAAIEKVNADDAAQKAKLSEIEALVTTAAAKIKTDLER